MSLILSIVGVLVAAGSVQQPAAAAAPLVVAGCLAQASNNGSLTGGPGVPPATPNSAPVLANSTEPTGAYILNGAIPSKGPQATAAADAQKPRTYVLDGAASQLQPHVGHQVEVTGRLIRTHTATAQEKTPVDHIEVASVKMLAATCPPSPTPK